MDRATAYSILRDSLTNLQQRRGQVTLADLEAEVINNVCLAILRKEKQAQQNKKSIEELFSVALSSIQLVVPYTQAFTEAAALLSDKYRDREATMAIFGVQQNIAWEGMWDYLREYFQKNHGIQIDSEATSAHTFYSLVHRRYENGSLTAESKVERTINFSFIGNDHEEVLVSIEPTLSPKKGYLIEKSSSFKKYKGYDPDYLFTIHFGDFDEVERFILEMPKRLLMIEYFE
jgi:hypothetical protein